MALTNNLGRISAGLTADASLNIGVGVTPSGTFRFEVGTTSKFTGVATFGSTLSNGTYTYTLPSATGTLALTSALSGYLPLTAGSSFPLTGGLFGTTASFAVSVGNSNTGLDLTNNGALGYGNSINFYQNATKVAQIFCESSAANTSEILFKTTVASTLATRLIINSAGKVGIGQNSPNYSLTVNGSIQAGYILLGDTGNGNNSTIEFVNGPNSTSYFGGSGNINYSGAGNLTLCNGGGRVGIGTPSPNYLLDIVGTTPMINIQAGANNNARGIQFNYNGSFVIGSLINFGGTGENALSAGSTGTSGYFLTFKTDGTEKMRITNAWETKFSGQFAYGAVYINTAGNGAPYISAQGSAGSNTVGAAAYFNLTDAFTSGTRQWLFQIDGSNQLTTWYYNGSTWNVKGYQTTGGTWTNSDERKKINIQDLEYGLKELLELKPKKFNFIHDIEEGKVKQMDMGLIAQEVLPIIPLAVDTYNENKNEFYSMNYANLVPVLVKAIQEQQQQIKELQSQINK